MPNVSIKIKFPNWKERFERNKDRILRFIAAQIQTNRGMLFDSEGAHNGHEKWAPLKYREGQILSKSGVLRKSIAPYNAQGKPGSGGIVRIVGDLKRAKIDVGTQLAYAPLMNWGTAGLPGGAIVPVNKKALRFKIGTKWIFAHSVKIPARRFDEWNDQDKNELQTALKNLIVQVLNGG